MGATEVELGQIAAALGGDLIGDPHTVIDNIAPLEGAGARSIAFLSNPRYQAQLAASAAGCVIVGETMRDAATARGAALITPDPYASFARLTQWWAARVRPRPVPGIHPTAVIDPSAFIAADASVGALAVVEADARIEAGAVVSAQCFVGRNAQVGAASVLHPRVVLSFDCRIGARCIVHSGAVIGADGFGLAPTADGYVKIEQLGAVSIGDDVEIGANTCIDRGALGDTVLADGVKLDNLVQIAHNAQIGRHTAMAAFAGVAGSTRIGERCTAAAGAGFVGHIQIADDVHVTARTAVTRSLPKPGVYSGMYPFDEHRVWEKNAVSLRQLSRLRDRIRALERHVGSDKPAAASPAADPDATS